MPILHKIKSYLYNNVLTKDDPDGLTARTVSELSLSVKQICNSAVNCSDADILSATMEHATQLYLKEMVYPLCDGFLINTVLYGKYQYKMGFQQPQIKHG